MKKTFLIFALLVFSFIMLLPHRAFAFQLINTNQQVIPTDISDSVILLGDNINLTHNVDGDLYVMGNEVNISGDVAGNVIIIATKVHTAGRIKQDLYIAAADITIGSEVQKNTRIFGSDISLADTALLKGSLIYRAEHAISMDGGSRVLGPVNAGNMFDIKNMFQHVKSATLLLASLSTLLSVLSAFVIGLILLYFLPNFSLAIVTSMKIYPWRNLGIGLLILILIPLLVVALAIPVLPLALITAALYITSLYLARIITALFLGTYLLKNAHQYTQLFFGILLVTILSFIPVFGPITLLVFTIIYLGASFVEKRSLLTSLRKKKLL